MKLKHVRLLKKGIALGILIALTIVFSILKKIPIVSENFYARGISRAYVFIFGHISDLFPFSIYEIFLIAAIIVISVSLILTIITLTKHKRFKAVNHLVKLCIFIMSFVLIYTISAGGLYYREKAPVKVYTGEQLTKEDLTALAFALLDDFNNISNELTYENGKSDCPYDFYEVAELLKKEYTKLDTAYYKNYYNSYTPTAKKGMFSFLMSYQGICGITFLPTGEATINAQTPQCYRIVTMAHEIAHTKGVMTEREANLIAYYILLSSDIPYFRYCGYMYSIGYLTGILYQYNDTELTEQLKNAYPQAASRERSMENNFFLGKKTIVDTISTFFNDVYLKLSGVNDGVNNYSDPSKITLSSEQNPEIIINYSNTARLLILLAQDQQK